MLSALPDDHGLLLRARAEIEIGQLPERAIVAPHAGAVRPGPEPLEPEAAPVAPLHVGGEPYVPPLECRLELQVDLVESLPLAIDEASRVNEAAVVLPEFHAGLASRGDLHLPVDPEAGGALSGSLAVVGEDVLSGCEVGRLEGPVLVAIEVADPLADGPRASGLRIRLSHQDE